jgi:hypothetical protein
MNHRRLDNMEVYNHSNAPMGKTTFRDSTPRSAEQAETFLLLVIYFLLKLAQIDIEMRQAINNIIVGIRTQDLLFRTPAVLSRQDFFVFTYICYFFVPTYICMYVSGQRLILPSEASF